MTTHIHAAAYLPRIGTSWRLTQDVERYPSFVASAGMIGKVVSIEFQVEDPLGHCFINLKMKDGINGCEEWDNCIVFQYDDDNFRREFWESCELVMGCDDTILDEFIRDYCKAEGIECDGGVFGQAFMGVQDWFTVEEAIERIESAAKTYRLRLPKNELLRLASAAKPINDEEWGSDRQINAENEFFALAVKHLSAKDAVALEDYCLKGTIEENIAYALELLELDDEK